MQVAGTVLASRKVMVIEPLLVPVGFVVILVAVAVYTVYRRTQRNGSGMTRKDDHHPGGP